MKTIISILSLAFILGCSSTQIKHLESQKFIEQASETEQMNSAYKTTYIGKTDSRIYLEYYTAITSVGKGKTIVYWTELSKLSKEQVNYILGLKTAYKNK